MLIVESNPGWRLTPLSGIRRTFGIFYINPVSVLISPEHTLPAFYTPWARTQNGLWVNCWMIPHMKRISISFNKCDMRIKFTGWRVLQTARLAAECESLWFGMVQLSGDHNYSAFVNAQSLSAWIIIQAGKSETWIQESTLFMTRGHHNNQSLLSEFLAS